MDSIPSLLGLALRAGRLAVGEEPVGTACRCHKGYLLLLASDAADNTIRRALHFSQAGKTICLTLRLAQDDQKTYGEAWQTLAQKAARVKQRRDAKRSPNKNKGKRRKA